MEYFFDRFPGSISWNNDVKIHGIEISSMQRIGLANQRRGEYMRYELPVRSTRFDFSMSKCAVALLCSAFLIEPLYAQTLNWPNNGNDQGNMRYQDIDQITPANVSQLKPAWI